MPEMSGRELAAHVAALAPGTPMIFTSGYPDGDVARRGLLLTGTAFIQKPFTPEAIVRIVHQTLNAHHLGTVAEFSSADMSKGRLSDPALP